MEKPKIEFGKIIRHSGIILLFFIVNILLITNLLFFVRISITSWNVLIAATITILEYVLLYRKKSSILEMIISMFLTLIAIGVFVLLANQTYDLSWDGNTYHKTAIGSLKNGWNPVYEKVEDFNVEKGNKIDVSLQEQNRIWINHYPKASWIFAANIYSITNNIESAKILNLLMMYICFCLISTFLSKKINKIWAVIITLIIVINPITVTQTFNYYIDGLLGINLFIILYSLIAITDYKSKINEEGNLQYKEELKEHFIVLANVLVIIINLKFTGLVYAAIFCFLFYVYWLYQAYKNKNIKEAIIKYTIFYIISVLISVLIVGYSSYMKNIFYEGHPFYPLFGKNKEDIITWNQPHNFNRENVIKKFSISLFGEGSNIHDSYGKNKEEPKLKIPFTITENELKQYARPDTRISRFWSNL